MHIRSPKETAWILAILFSSLSLIFWLQIGLNAITSSLISEEAMVQLYEREKEVAAGQSLQHLAASEVEAEGVPSNAMVEWEPESLQKNALQAWELRRAFRISIPALGIRAPVLLPSRTHWDARNWELLEEQMQAGMLQGTVAYPHSSRPGAGGALFIAGHSSPPTLEAKESPYGTVFAALPNVDIGQEITITDDDERFTYIVTETFIVLAEDTGILEPGKEERTLTLITCYPVGTTRQRFVVRAKRRIEA